MTLRRKTMQMLSGLLTAVTLVTTALSPVVTYAAEPGSTDTTIYVLCLYFTSVGVTKWKHALKVGLFADIVGISVGIILTLVFLNN